MALSLAREYIFRASIPIVVLVSLAIKFLYFDYHSLWLDEAYTVWFTNRSWHELWFWVPTFESHPPFYYSLMKFWGSTWGEQSGLSYRIASIVLSLGVYVFAVKALCRLNSSLGLQLKSSLLLLTILFSFCPILFWYSLEARPYMLLSLGYAVSICATITIHLEDESKQYSTWMLLILGTTITNWSHNLGPFYSAVIFLALLLNTLINKRSKKKFVLLFLSALIVSIFSTPLLVIILKQLTQWQAGSWIHEPSLNNLWHALNYLLNPNHLRPHFESLFQGQILLNSIIHIVLKSVPVLVASYGLFRLFVSGHISLSLMFVLAVLFVPVVTFIISIFGPNIFLSRTLIPIVIPLYILFSVSVGFVGNKYISSAIILFFVVMLSVGTYDELRWSKKEPWHEITATLINEKVSDGLILLLPNSIRIPIEIYDGKKDLESVLVSLPAKYPALNFSSFYPAGTPAVPGITEDNIYTINKLIENVDSVILLTRAESLFDPNGLVKKALSDKFELFASKSWGGIKMYEYNKLKQ